MHLCSKHSLGLHQRFPRLFWIVLQSDSSAKAYRNARNCKRSLVGKRRGQRSATSCDCWIGRDGVQCEGLTMVVVAAAMSSLTRKATIQGLKGEADAAHFPATTADTSSHGNSSSMRPTQGYASCFEHNPTSKRQPYRDREERKVESPTYATCFAIEEIIAVMIWLPASASLLTPFSRSFKGAACNSTEITC